VHGRTIYMTTDVSLAPVNHDLGSQLIMKIWLNL
jgi:hypothetical protein